MNKFKIYRFIKVFLRVEYELTKKELFQGKEIRRILVDDEWWFSVVDVVGLLSESEEPYWAWMKVREKQIELSSNPRQLEAPDTFYDISLHECFFRKLVEKSFLDVGNKIV